jgi:hypothetical protein
MFNGSLASGIFFSKQMPLCFLLQRMVWMYDTKEMELDGIDLQNIVDTVRR